MAFSILTKLCNDRHNHLENIFITPQRNPKPIGNHSSFLPTSFPSSPGQPLPSVSIDLLMLDVSCKRNYIIQGLLRLASLLSMFCGSSVLETVSVFHSFWLPNLLLNTQLYGRATFVYPLRSWWTLGCFHFVAAMSNAQVFVWTCIFIHFMWSGIVGPYQFDCFPMLNEDNSRFHNWWTQGKVLVNVALTDIEKSPFCCQHRYIILWPKQEPGNNSALT